MSLATACCALLFTFFNLNTDKVTPSFIESPFSLLRSLFETKKSYTVVLIGDSMTQTLGTADILRDDLKKYYPNKEFGILNFGIGATSILSVPERLKNESKRGAETLPPVLETKPDIILLESFGNNPLSHLSLEEGLKKQNEILDEIVKMINDSDPKPRLVFVATIAPSKAKYAEGIVELSSEQREQWVEERIAYIQNHINYAKTHNIPLVNIYQNSLNNGDGNTMYLSGDFIHPSPQGLEFISQQIAEIIYKKSIIPH